LTNKYDWDEWKVYLDSIRGFVDVVWETTVYKKM